MHDDEIDDGRRWNLEEKLTSSYYDAAFVIVLEDGTNFDLKYFQEHNFDHPIFFKNKTGLGLRVPSSNFNVNDVKNCVGGQRLIDVMDVHTQKALLMKMKDWVVYYNSQERDRLLNVISLEFSHSKLDNYVESPTVVRQLDWLDRAWPFYLKMMQTDTSNNMDGMKYPKVRKYALMSVANCYTDWHIDFGGTSVWYHILRGEKVFWLIRPTEENISRFEQWCLSGCQGENFFGDLVEQGECQRITLPAGVTFLIPSGWMHAVFTPKDSLVFGGNFLHTYSAATQLRVWKTEDKTRVNLRFRYPYYTELHWYVLARYVACLLGREHVIPMDDQLELISPDDLEEKKKIMTQCPEGKEKLLLYETRTRTALLNQTDLILSSADTRWQYMTKYELEGLRMVREWIDTLPPHRTYLPADIPHPDILLQDVDLVLQLHEHDDTKLAIVGNPLLKWPPDAEGNLMINISKPLRTGTKARGVVASPVKRSSVQEWDDSGPSHRRVRCHVCEPCRRENCQECHFCHDMKKYGGRAVMKQCCIQKQCIMMKLPKNTCCGICGKTTRATDEEMDADDYNAEDDLFECGICWKVMHPSCLRRSFASNQSSQDNGKTPSTRSRRNVTEQNNEDSIQSSPETLEGCKVNNIDGDSGIVMEISSKSEDLSFHPILDIPNYWECFTCILNGKQGCSKARKPKGIVLLRKMEREVADGGKQILENHHFYDELALLNEDSGFAASIHSFDWDEMCRLVDGAVVIDSIDFESFSSLDQKKTGKIRPIAENHDNRSQLANKKRPKRQAPSLDVPEVVPVGRTRSREIIKPKRFIEGL